MKSYLRVLFSALVLLFWCWSVTNSFAALSSASNFGVVLGIVGLISSSALDIWLLYKLLYKKAKTHEKAVDVGSSGGDPGR